MLFDFGLDEVGTIRTLLREELRPRYSVTFNSRRRRYVVVVVVVVGSFTRREVSPIA